MNMMPMTVPLRGEKSPKLQKITVSQQTSTTRKGDGRELCPNPEILFYIK